MDIREEAIDEIRKAPEEVVAEAVDFLRFLKARTQTDRFATAVATEPVLRGDWETPEEDEAWRDL